MRALPEDEPLKAHQVVGAALNHEWQKREDQDRHVRAQVVNYDDMLDAQRSLIYAERRKILEGTDIQARRMISETVQAYITDAAAKGLSSRHDMTALLHRFEKVYPISITIDDLTGIGPVPSPEAIADHVETDAQAAYDRREQELGSDAMRELERRVTLGVIDRLWREHLTDLDALSQDLRLRALGGRDALTEYRREGATLFNAMRETTKPEVVGYLFNLEVDAEALSDG
jgi:preprotein translocase subunit SecA